MCANRTAPLRLVNLAAGPPGVKFKKSAMPFVQMENISHFLRACKAPPLNLQEHDMFLTVDLYEQKDPAQVLQCLGAFSRAAQRVNPASFSSSIGPKSRGAITPQSTGPSPTRARGMSTVSNTSSVYGHRPMLIATKTGDSSSGGRWSPTKSPPADRVGSPSVSSWSKRDHEGVTSPAWNIAQYGYMGGASQGNLGIAFGGRRQITSAGPHVPNLAEKERRRREQEAEAERQRQQIEEEERIRRAEQEAEEERARLEEERRWEEETRRQREEERLKADEEKRRWDEEERQWRLTNEKRRQEEEEAEARLAEERRRTRSKSNSQLQGQFLSQYQAEHGLTPQKSGGGGYSDRVKELEEELELARQREREYEEERERRGRGGDAKSRHRSRSRPKLPSRPPSRQDSYVRGEREVLRTQWDRHQEEMANTAPAPTLPVRPLPDPRAMQPQRTGEAPSLPLKPQRTGESRPLPVPDRARAPVPGKPSTLVGSSATRPLPNPSAASNRTDRFLAKNPAPAPAVVQQSYSRELDTSAEHDAEDRRRQQSQAKTKAGGWASKSLLEREMEMERQRQREWEEAQKETASRAAQGGAGDGVDGIGGGVGGRWDVSQWSGYTGGDNQNKGGTGIGAARRQIVGPRPLPGRP
jgi:transgelin